MKKSGNLFLVVIGIIFWLLNLIYGIWYLLNGWDEQNAIMAFCSTLNDTSLGWLKYVCGHGVLNFIAGYGAIYPLAAPIVLLIASLLNKSISKGMEKTIALFWNLLIMVALAACCLYSSLYFMEQHPVISGLFVLGTIFSVLCSCASVYTIVIVVD